METNLTTEGTAPLYQLHETKGYISLGTPAKYGTFIAVNYTPTEEQIKNLREMFGWDFISNAQMNELMKEWNK